MKKVFAKILGLVLCLILVASVTIAGAAERSEVTPRFTGIDAQVVSLTINEYGRANCDCSVLAKTGYSVDVTMALEQDGTAIKTWTGSGARVDLSKVYYVAENHDYQVIVTSRVYTSGGSYLCSYTTDSQIYSF